MIGTKDNEINDNKKIVGEIFKSLSSLIDDKKNIIIKPRKTKDKCFKKKAQSFVSNLSETNKDVDTKEKNKPVKNNRKISENISLSIFFHHS